MALWAVKTELPAIVSLPGAALQGRLALEGLLSAACELRQDAVFSPAEQLTTERPDPVGIRLGSG